MTLDTTRHLDVINPAKFDKQITIIGAGAVGSNVANQIARLGLKATLYDMDNFEPHNVPNQFCMMQHVGQNKAQAVAAFINEGLRGEYITPVTERCDTLDNIPGFVFLLVDTMEDRKKLAETARYTQSQVIIETRMGAFRGDRFVFRPATQLKEWMEYWFDDDAPAEVSSCGGTLSVGSTAAAVASYAVWGMIDYFNNGPAMVPLHKAIELRG